MKLTPLLSLASSRSALLAVGLLALQSCEYVHDVVVPAKDTGLPLAAVTLWDPKTNDHTWVAGQTVVNNDPDAASYFITSGFDHGGISRLSVCYFTRVTDKYGVVHEKEYYQQLHQAGTIGSTVDNGLWYPIKVVPSQLAADVDGWIDFECNFQVLTEDFHGNLDWVYESEGTQLVCKP
jgi:hypothetical protein